jgi:6-phosphogluconolactonase
MRVNKQFQLDDFNYQSALEISDSIKDHLLFNKTINICLSGGTTPLPVLNVLKDKNLDFDRISFFLGDERDVSNNHTDSNYFNLNNYFFKHISSKNYPINHDQYSIDEAVYNYQNKIIDKVPLINNIPKFNIILLGMGLDGHTASLFPGSKALEEKKELIVKNYIDKLASYRITMSYPLILNASEIIILIQGEEKKKLIENLSNHHPIKKIIDSGNNLKILCSTK